MVLMVVAVPRSIRTGLFADQGLPGPGTHGDGTRGTKE